MTPMIEQRITSLEHREEFREGLVMRMDEKLDSIVDTLHSLVRIEERQLATAEKLAQGSATLVDHDLRLRVLEVAMPKELDLRLGKIEIAMPALKEGRAWVVGGVLAGISLILLAVVKLVLVPGVTV